MLVAPRADRKYLCLYLRMRVFCVRDFTHAILDACVCTCVRPRLHERCLISRLSLSTRVILTLSATRRHGGSSGSGGGSNSELAYFLQTGWYRTLCAGARMRRSDSGLLAGTSTSNAIFCCLSRLFVAAPLRSLHPTGGRVLTSLLLCKEHIHARTHAHFSH